MHYPVKCTSPSGSPPNGLECCRPISGSSSNLPKHNNNKQTSPCNNAKRKLPSSCDLKSASSNTPPAKRPINQKMTGRFSLLKSNISKKPSPTLSKDVDPKVFDVPKVGTFHAAYWYEQGQSCKNGGITLGSKPHYSKDITKISALLKAFDPDIYKKYLERVNKLLDAGVENKLDVGEFNVFLGRAFNVNQQSVTHRDRKDYAKGWTALHC
ncbi:hypothetical protein AKO1_004026, partial [Acrasis kona]